MSGINPSSHPLKRYHQKLALLEEKRSVAHGRSFRSVSSVLMVKSRFSWLHELGFTKSSQSATQVGLSNQSRSTKPFYNTKTMPHSIPRKRQISYRKMISTNIYQSWARLTRKISTIKGMGTKNKNENTRSLAIEYTTLRLFKLFKRSKYCFLWEL